MNQPKVMIGFQEALSLILKNVPQGVSEEVSWLEATGRVLAEDAVAKVDSPLSDVALKDGYAVFSSDVTSARPDREVKLRLLSFKGAGDSPGQALEPGTAIRVTTGAVVPPGAQAVLAQEFTREEQDTVCCLNDAEPGRNILPKGTDVRAGEVVARQGERLSPALVGLLACAGLDHLWVVSRPLVAVIATGDEVVVPGGPLGPGQIYASNMVETVSWLQSFGLPEVSFRVVKDRADEIKAAIEGMSSRVDAFITSGGAWQSERDLVLQVLEDLGWHEIFRHVRLGPGKAVAFGLLQNRPVFILSGGPPSYETAFLELALPGLLAMAGWRGPVFPTLKARLEEAVRGEKGWTQAIHAKVTFKDRHFCVRPYKTASRLSSMARKDGIIIVPEGQAELAAGEEVEVQVISLEPLSNRSML
ncbi:MAG: molybdopterin molybdotransferase MoeA [Deltaproteobacteria bacterium]|nr:molybdopterin molybdotransferase MoeA [Deltaproteobacteria bacterium]